MKLWSVSAHGSSSTDCEAVVFARREQKRGACSRAVCAGFRSSTGRVLWPYRACSSSCIFKSEVGNSNYFVVFSNWLNEFCDSWLSNLIEEL